MEVYAIFEQSIVENKLPKMLANYIYLFFFHFTEQHIRRVRGIGSCVIEFDHRHVAHFNDTYYTLYDPRGNMIFKVHPTEAALNAVQMGNGDIVVLRQSERIYLNVYDSIMQLKHRRLMECFYKTTLRSMKDVVLFTSKPRVISAFHTSNYEVIDVIATERVIYDFYVWRDKIVIVFADYIGIYNSADYTLCNKIAAMVAGLHATNNELFKVEKDISKLNYDTNEFDFVCPVHPKCVAPISKLYMMPNKLIVIVDYREALYVIEPQTHTLQNVMTLHDPRECFHTLLPLSGNIVITH